MTPRLQPRGYDPVRAWLPPGRFPLFLGRVAALFILAIRFLTLSAVAGEWTETPWGRLNRVAPAAEGRTGFTALSPVQTGIVFSNQLSDISAGFNQVRMNGSGVALGDVNGDGLCDVYFCGLETSNRLYLNLGGWKFKDVTSEAGLSAESCYSTGALFSDVDGDGDLDLLVNAIGQGTRLYLNNGKGLFSERAESALNRPSGSMSMSMADLDGDGDLDLYVVNYRTNTIRSTGYSMIVDRKGKIQPDYVGQYEVTAGGRLLEYGEPDRLLMNDGQGHFTAVSWTQGQFLDEDGKALTQEPRDWGLSVMLRDFNGDGLTDIYVCNDFWSPDRLWLNEGKGNFRAAPRTFLRHTSAFSMGMDVADMDRDGHDDFFVLDMLSPVHQRRLRQRGGLGQIANTPARIDSRPQIERNTLFWNRGDGSYAEIACLAGVHASEWSWGTVFLDVDLDGYEDLLITTGNLFDMQDDDIGSRMASSPRRPLAERLFFAPRLEVPSMAFRNQGDLRFEDVGAAWGFNTTGVAHGIALADLDNDGDLDVVVNRLNGFAGLYRNESPRPRVEVALKGVSPNTRAVGARIRVSGGPVTQSQTVISGGRYLSSDEGSRSFAAWAVTNQFAVEVTWPDGRVSLTEGIPANAKVEIAEAKVSKKGVSPIANEKAEAPALFLDVSERLDDRHRDLPHDDFAVQPVLSRRQDTPGPCVAWLDVDGDGWEDLVRGGGAGGALSMHRNRGGGRFESWTNAATAITAGLDQTSIVGWQEGSGNLKMIVGSRPDALADQKAATLIGVSTKDGTTESIMAEPPASVGALAIADVDGDGELDLFVGGRSVPGRYPQASRSVLLRRVQQRWILDEANTRALGSVGLVQGAVWSDMDGDGDPDLLLATEWGPVQLWLNERGVLREATREWGLEGYRGWWQGVTTADVDGDGRLDIIASNWGRNTLYQTHLKPEFRLYFGDLVGRGTEDLMESCWDPRSGAWVPWRDRRTAVRAMPALQERFPTAGSFADATMDTLFGPALQKASVRSVNWLDSTVFLNRTNRFVALSLPLLAQQSPAFGVCAGDLDGDGVEDLFLAQNFFGNEDTVCREDAGRGLCLKGRGDGTFVSMSAKASGISMDGEQRGAALCDFDGDGRLDLVVGQHDSQTKLYWNQRAQPGLRVRCAGSPQNPQGVGVQLRARHGEGWGRVQELKCGGGYGGADSKVIVITGPTPTALQVRWPWKPAIEVTVPPRAREVIIHSDGRVEGVR